MPSLMETIAEIPLFIEMPLVFMSYLIRPGKKKKNNTTLKQFVIESKVEICQCLRSKHRPRGSDPDVTVSKIATAGEGCSSLLKDQ